MKTKVFWITIIIGVALGIYAGAGYYSLSRLLQYASLMTQEQLQGI